MERGEAPSRVELFVVLAVLVVAGVVFVTVPGVHEFAETVAVTLATWTQQFFAFVAGLL